MQPRSNQQRKQAKQKAIDVDLFIHLGMNEAIWSTSVFLLHWPSQMRPKQIYKISMIDTGGVKVLRTPIHVQSRDES